jgi:hypothetical protein
MVNLKWQRQNKSNKDNQSENLNFVGGESMNLMNLINELVTDRRAVIAAACRVQLRGRFFLIIELEIGSGANEIERVFVIEISRALFNALAGRVDLCEVRNDLPTPPQGTTLELRCTFVLGNEAFIVFEIENMRDRLVIVRSELCTVI